MTKTARCHTGEHLASQTVAGDRQGPMQDSFLCRLHSLPVCVVDIIFVFVCIFSTVPKRGTAKPARCPKARTVSLDIPCPQAAMRCTHQIFPNKLISVI